MIRSSRHVDAPSALVVDLLRDVAAWRLWSPHVASVEPPSGRVRPGQVLRVRPWFGPPTRMRVESVDEPAHDDGSGGLVWSTPGLGHVLRYATRSPRPDRRAAGWSSPRWSGDRRGARRHG